MFFKNNKCLNVKGPADTEKQLPHFTPIHPLFLDVPLSVIYLLIQSGAEKARLCGEVTVNHTFIFVTLRQLKIQFMENITWKYS